VIGQNRIGPHRRLLPATAIWEQSSALHFV
jgi:hypothetical protein